MSLSALQSAACCAVCRNFETKGTTSRIFAQFLIHSDIKRKAQLEECLLCALFYQTFLNYDVSSPIGAGMYVQAQFGSPFYATWSEEDGRAFHIEIYQQKGMFLWDQDSPFAVVWKLHKLTSEQEARVESRGSVGRTTSLQSQTTLMSRQKSRSGFACATKRILAADSKAKSTPSVCLISKSRATMGYG